MKEARNFEREELITLRGRAEALAVAGTSPRWIRAYQSLADAADRLDAMTQRTVIGGPGDVGPWT